MTHAAKSLAAALAAALFISACGGRSTPAPAGPPALLGALPLPAFEPLAGRAASSADYYRLGEQYNSALESSRISPGPATSLTLQPNFGPTPGGRAFTDMAFAAFSFPVSAGAFATGGRFSTSYLPAAPGLTWIGLSDYSSGAWRWFELGAEGRVDLPDLATYFNGGAAVHCAVVQLGVANDAVIDWVRLGPDTPSIGLPFQSFDVAVATGVNPSELILVDGNPAFIAHLDNGGEAVANYFRAGNAEGSAWDAPVPLGSASWSSPSLAIINGRPAAAFGGAQSGVAYCRALDATGASWGPPQYVDTGNGGWAGGVLFEVNGLPALAYVCGDNSVRYIRANDADGAGWPAASAILHGPGVFAYSNLAAGVIGGVPQAAAAWADFGADTLKVLHWRGGDADGAGWDAGAEVFSAPFTNHGIHNLNLVELRNNVPGIGWFLEDYNAPADNCGYFAVADDGMGGGWGEPEPLFLGDPGPAFPATLKFAVFDTVEVNTDKYLLASAVVQNSIGLQRGEMCAWPISQYGTLDFNGDFGHCHLEFLPTAESSRLPAALKSASTFESWAEMRELLLTDPFGYIIIMGYAYGYLPDWSSEFYWGRTQINPGTDFEWTD